MEWRNAPRQLPAQATAGTARAAFAAAALCAGDRVHRAMELLPCMGNGFHDLCSASAKLGQSYTHRVDVRPKLAQDTPDPACLFGRHSVRGPQASRAQQRQNRQPAVNPRDPYSSQYSGRFFRMLLRTGSVSAKPSPNLLASSSDRCMNWVIPMP